MPLSVGITVNIIGRDVAGRFQALPDEMSRQVRTAVLSLQNQILADFQATTATWEHQVDFIVLDDGPSAGSFAIGTADAIYGLVNAGSPPHPIFPKASFSPGRARQGMLHFPTLYVHKTYPRQILSGPGGYFGPSVFANRVAHPGFPARQFDVAIADKWRPLAAGVMQGAIRGAVVNVGLA